MDRSIEVRKKEHLKDKINSAFGKYLHEHRHHIDGKNMKVLHSYSEGINMTILETLGIDIHKKQKITCLYENSGIKFIPMYRSREYW